MDRESSSGCSIRFIGRKIRPSGHRMNKYNIEAQVIEHHSVNVEAESLEQAERIASDLGYDTANAYRTDVQIISIIEK